LRDVLDEPWFVLRFLRPQPPEFGLQTGLEMAADRRRADLARTICAFGRTGA
jgi:hypothetical protein